MSKIPYPKGRMLQVRDCTVAICNDNNPGSVLLSVLLYWYEYPHKGDFYNEEEKTFTVCRTQPDIELASCNQINTKTIHDTAVPLLTLFGYLTVKEKMNGNLYTVQLERVLNGFQAYEKGVDALKSYLKTLLQLESAPIKLSANELESVLINKRELYLQLERVLIQIRGDSNCKRGRKPKKQALPDTQTADTQSNLDSLENTIRDSFGETFDNVCAPGETLPVANGIPETQIGEVNEEDDIMGRDRVAHTGQAAMESDEANGVLSSGNPLEQGLDDDAVSWEPMDIGNDEVDPEADTVKREAIVLSKQEESEAMRHAERTDTPGDPSLNGSRMPEPVRSGGEHTNHAAQAETVDVAQSTPAPLSTSSQQGGHSSHEDAASQGSASPVPTNPPGSPQEHGTPAEAQTPEKPKRTRTRKPPQEKPAKPTYTLTAEQQHFWDLWCHYWFNEGVPLLLSKTAYGHVCTLAKDVTTPEQLDSLVKRARKDLEALTDIDKKTVQLGNLVYSLPGWRQDQQPKQNPQNNAAGSARTTTQPALSIEAIRASRQAREAQLAAQQA